MPLLKTILREIFFLTWIQLLVLGSFHPVAEAKSRPNKKQPAPVSIQVSEQEILSESQISYRAHGGFSEVDSYTVMISCVKGKISTYRAVRNNRHGTFRRTGTMSAQAYLQLWETLSQRRVLTMKDAPAPLMDILDEFTVEFEIKVGEHSNTFSAYGCSRPEAASYFALRNLIDRASDMQTVWNLHDSVSLK